MKKATNAIIDESDIKGILKLFLKNALIFLILVGIAVAISFITVYRAKVVHAASITIMMEGGENSSIRDAVLQGLGIGASYENIDNEIRIIASAPLVGVTVDRLNLDVSYFIKGQIRTTEIYQGEGVPFVVILDDTKPNIMDSEIQIDILSGTRFQLSSEEYQYEEIHHFGKWVHDDRFNLRIDATNKIAKTLEKQGSTDDFYYFQINSHRNLVSMFKDAISVQQFEWPAAYIEVSVTDAIPNRARDFLDTLAQVYIEHSMRTLKSINRRALVFIEDQLEEIVSELNRIELRLEEFKSKNVRYSVESESSWYIGELMSYENEKTKLIVRLGTLDFLKESIVDGESSIRVVPSILNSAEDGLLIKSLVKLIELEGDKRKALLQGTKEGPLYKRIVAEMENMNKDAVKLIDLTKTAIKSKMETLDKQISRFNSLVKKIPKKERELINIRRKLDINEKFYLILLEKKSETLIAKSGIVPTKSVLEPSDAEGIVSPNRERIYITNVGLALALGLMVMLIRQIFFNTIDNKVDLENLTDLPILGMVNKSKFASEDTLITETHPKSEYAEAFRSIRANLEYLVSGVDSKIILVTSCLAGEGKTFTCLNLGYLLGQAKKKVLLIDLDMHRPKLAKRLGIENKVGVSTFLIEKCKFKDIINKTKWENMDIVNAGPVAPNASELILHPNMENLLERARKEYEYVILDTPPVGIISDAVVLMKKADVNIFVLKASFAKKNFIALAEEIKEKNNPKNLCLVLNNIKKRFYAKGYGYSASYGGDRYVETDNK